MAKLRDIWTKIVGVSAAALYKASYGVIALAVVLVVLGQSSMATACGVIACWLQLERIHKEGS